MTREQYREALKVSGATKRERVINKAIHDTNLLAKDSPSYKEVTIDDILRKVNIISSTITTQKIFRTIPGEDFNIGSIMVWNNSHWLITERDSDDEITVRGKIQICQKEIRWQDTDSKEIVSLWATVEKPYYSNLNENNYISYSTREFKVQMPFDEYSAKLNVGKRLMLEIVDGEPKTYRITSIDQMTGRIDYNGKQIGFLTLNVEQDLYNKETDNAEKMICDYIEQDSISNKIDPIVDSIVIKYSGTPSVVNGGFGKKFSAEVNGEENDFVTWSLTGDSSVRFKDEISSGSCVYVVCDDNPSIIGLHVILTAKYNTSFEEIDLEVV